VKDAVIIGEKPSSSNQICAFFARLAATGPAKQVEPVKKSPFKFFPDTPYVLFDAAKFPQVHAKLVEFNTTLQDSSVHIDSLGAFLTNLKPFIIFVAGSSFVCLVGQRALPYQECVRYSRKDVLLPLIRLLQGSIHGGS
jgi:hypothetical protein